MFNENSGNDGWSPSKDVEETHERAWEGATEAFKERVTRYLRSIADARVDDGTPAGARACREVIEALRGAAAEIARWR